MTDDQRAQLLGYTGASDPRWISFAASHQITTEDVLAAGARNLAASPGPGLVVNVSTNPNSNPVIIDRYGTDTERDALIATGMTNDEYNWIGKQRWVKWNDGQSFDGGSAGQFRGDNDIDKHIRMGAAPDGKTTTSYGSTSSWAKWLDPEAAALAAAAGLTPAQWVAKSWFDDVRRNGGIADQRAAQAAAAKAAADRAAAELALKAATDAAAAAAATKATTTAGNAVIPLRPPLLPLTPPAPSSTPVLTLAVIAAGWLVIH